MASTSLQHPPAVAGAGEAGVAIAIPVPAAGSATADERRMDPRLLMALRTGDHNKLDELLRLTGEDEIIGQPRASAAAAVPVRVVAGASGIASGSTALQLLEGVTFDSQGDSALHVVAASGDCDCYLRCARKIYDTANHLLKARNKHGDTPLHCAARAGNRDMVDCLLKMVREAETQDHAAAAGGASSSTSRFERFLREENDMRETALHSAIRSLDLCLIEMLMREDPELARFPGGDDTTSPLYLAISSHLPLHRVQQLFEISTGYSTSGPDGQNVLHIAVWRDFFRGKVVQYLLDWIPPSTTDELTKQPDKDGNTALHLAASKDMWDKTLLTVFVHTVGSNIAYPFWILPYMPMEGPTMVLIKAREASVFQPDNKGSYPIHVAAASGRLKAIVVLLESFPSCAALRDDRGRTFLHVAVQKKMWVVVGYACHHPKLGSVLNMQDNNGNTALHLAVKGGNQCIFRYLFQNRQVLLGLPNKAGLTAVEIAWRRIPARGRFYHLLNPRYFIYRVLRIARAPGVISRTDQMEDRYRPMRYQREEEEEKLSDKMTKGSQVMGTLAALITSATFAAAFNLPGGRRPVPEGAAGGETPYLAGTYTFDAFVVSIALAFICALLATVGIIYSGFDSIDYMVRKFYFNRSYRLIQNSARSLAVAFGLGIYLVMLPVSLKIAIAVCVIVFFGLVFQNFEIWQSLILINTIRIRFGFWAALRLPMLGHWEPVVPLPLELVLQKFWSLIPIFLLPTPWISFFNHQAFIAVEILVLVPLLYWAFLKIIFWRFWNWLCY